MVSFFGLKFGTDKRKKVPAEPEPEIQHWKRLDPNVSEHNFAWRAQREEALKASTSRPRTAHGSSYASSIISLPDGERPGTPSSSSAAHAGLGPMGSGHGLKSFRSEANLKLSSLRAGNLSSTSLALPSDANLKLSSLRAGNLSSTSLAMPPTRRLGGDLDARPGTAHSMREMSGRGGAAAAGGRSGEVRRPTLDINFTTISSPSASFSGGSPQSLLGQYELVSPIKSDSESLLGEEPEKVANDITARITREEEELVRMRGPTTGIKGPGVVQKGPATPEIQRRDFAAPALGTAAAATTTTTAAAAAAAYPSPPASIEGDQQQHNVPSILVPGPRDSTVKPHAPASPALGDMVRPVSRGRQPQRRRQQQQQQQQQDVTYRHVPQNSISQDWRRRYDVGADKPDVVTAVPDVKVVVVEEPSIIISPLNANPSTAAGGGGGDGPSSSKNSSRSGGLEAGSSRSRERSRTEDNLSHRFLMLSPREPVRGATVPGARSPRSPLFQEMNPFYTHSEEEEGGEGEEHEEPTFDHRSATTNAPYGLPSPPLSHRQHPSDGQDRKPVVRTVGAKRDTVLVGASGRESLGLQIDKFEKSLQQAQAMSALEMKADAATVPAADLTTSRIIIRSRANSNASSNYSDISESPMTIEQPLFSPKPFPLSPRPMSPASGRPRLNAAPPGRPTLAVAPDSPLEQLRKKTADIILPRLATPEPRPESPAAAAAAAVVAGGAGGAVRARVGAIPRSRPSLEEAEEVNKASAVVATTTAGLTRFASPEGCDVHVERSESPRSVQGSFGGTSSPLGIESPILQSMTRPSPTSLEQTIADDLTSASTSPSESPGLVGSYSVFSPPPAAKRSAGAPRSVKTEWYGPAPMPPPTSPLPIPEKSARRMNTVPEVALPQQQPQQQLSTSSPSGSSSTTAPIPTPTSTGGLASPPLIASEARSSGSSSPSNPNWPLPVPSASPSWSSPVKEGGGVGFSARRSLLPDKRAPPAPLNIAATKYADDGGGHEGPWTPDPLVARQHGRSPLPLPPPPPDAADGGDALLLPGEDKSSAIGVARGLSIKYDQARDVERRTAAVRAREKARMVVEQQHQATTGASAGAAGTSLWKTAEEAARVKKQQAAAREARELAERIRRPNDGLRSPTGIADEQGVRFI